MAKRRFVQKRGYGANREAYDARRRARKLTAQDKAYREVLGGDPCCICAAPQPCEGRQHPIDHIVPLERGGQEHWSNYTVLCQPCNSSKKNRDLLGWMHGR